MPSSATSARASRSTGAPRRACRVVVRHGKIADAPPTPQISPHPQPAVPETALKRRKRDEAWAAKKAAAEAEAKAAAEKNSQEIFKRAEKYVKEYRDQVRFASHPSGERECFSGVAMDAPAAAAARARVARDRTEDGVRIMNVFVRRLSQSDFARARRGAPRGAHRRASLGRLR